ncbi:hypothetical protein cypCar_00036621, partial [Cyprinus carpio]
MQYSAVHVKANPPGRAKLASKLAALKLAAQGKGQSERASEDYTSSHLQQQFLCLKNIRTFLSACCEAFGMKKSELFEAFDLFDVRDFGK